MGKSKSYWPVLAGLGVFGIVVLLAASITACGCSGSHAAISAACMSNEKQITLSALMYADDNGDRFPPPNWMAKLTPYVKTKEVYHDPLLHNNGYGYAMNKEVVRFQMDNAKKPEQLPTFFDSPLMAPNAVTDFNAQPNPPRHDGHNNVAYLDGHVHIHIPNK